MIDEKYKFEDLTAIKKDMISIKITKPIAKKPTGSALQKEDTSKASKAGEGVLSVMPSLKKGRGTSNSLRSLISQRSTRSKRGKEGREQVYELDSRKQSKPQGALRVFKVPEKRVVQPPLRGARADDDGGEYTSMGTNSEDSILPEYRINAKRRTDSEVSY